MLSRLRRWSAVPRLPNDPALAGLVPVAVAVDQWTKALAAQTFVDQGSTPLLADLVVLAVTRNGGAFFSLGEALSPAAQRWVFSLLGAAALALMLHLYQRARRPLYRWSLILLTAGATGNLIDRLLYGDVIEFLHFQVKGVFHWATFNVADIYLALGIALLLLDIWRSRPKRPVSTTAFFPRP